MKKAFSFIIIFSHFFISVSCVSKSERQVAGGTQLKAATCSELVARAQDNRDVLNHLAALYAQKRQCSGFSFNLESLTEKELKIFSAVFDLTPTYNTRFKIPRPPELMTNKEKWLKVWALYKSPRQNEAATALMNLANSTDDMSEKSRAFFFLSKLYKKMKKPIESLKYMETAANNDFFSYHALAAHYELNRPLPPIRDILNGPATVFPFDPELSFLNSVDLGLFKALVQNDEYGMLNRTCYAFDKDWAQCANMGIYLAEKVKYYNMLHFSFSYVNDAYKKDLFIRYNHLIFPTPYLKIVTEMNQKTKTPVSFILAIIKQESSLYTYSISRAPAYGLMQLIPSLAKNLATKYNVLGFNKTEDLFIPEINIPLGTYELTDQIKLQKGQLTYVGIAYNAGPGRLKQWLAQPHSTDMFEFIEDIPYDETRNYVKIGARNMLFYQRLMQPTQEIYFPEKFVKSAD